MTALTAAVAIACQIPLVGGQVFLKHAMSGARRRWHFVAGIGCLSLWFFLWLGLLQQQELSRIFPFEGLNPAFMVIAAWFFLKEKVPPKAWVGVILVCVGIALVSGS